MAFKAIPVVAGKVAATLSDYPAYIKPSDMDGWEDLTLAEAESIRFYSDEAKTTELAREVVSADEIHVKVPSLTTTTTIYADYDGIRADYATDATYGAEAVWGDYEAVYHKNDLTTSTIRDSSGNSFDGDKRTANGPSQTTGKVGSAQDYSGGNDYVELPGNPVQVGENSHGSAGAWFKHNTGTTAQCIYFERPTNSNDRLYIYLQSGNVKLFLGTGTDRTLGSFTSGVWNKVRLTFNATNFVVYLNGTQLATNTYSASLGGGSLPAVIGSLNTTTWYFNGDIDEVTLLHSQLSADWELTEYNNQNDVGEFWGTVTDAGGATDPITKVKVSGTFVPIAPKVKIGGTFVEKTSKVKVGGTFV